MTAKQLAEQVGKSQIYLQKLEGGERDLPADTAQDLYDALGFSPKEIPFETQGLISEVGDSPQVYLGYVVIDSIVYFNQVSKEPLAADSIPMSGKHAKVLLQSQLKVFG